MNRRGFFGSIASFFEGYDTNSVFFGLQIVINSFPGDTVVQQLRTFAGSGTVKLESESEKQTFYKNVVALLLENYAYWEYGYWDFIPRQDAAVEEFETWVSEIDASTATVEAELGEEIDGAFRLSNDKYYVVVTLAFLQTGSLFTRTLQEILETLPEDDYYSRQTFQMLCQRINTIDFSHVERDAFFLVPGNNEDGLSWEDLRSGGWEYLHPIV